MNAIVAIARVEVLRSFKVVAVPVIAALGALLLALSGVRGSGTAFPDTALRGFILLSFPLAAAPAVILGLNLFGPDLKQRRLSFFMTRPCAPWELWLGRLAGAFVIASVGWALAAFILPRLGDPGIVWLATPANGLGPWFFALALAGLILATNALAMILAANSAAWFIADVCAALLFVTGLVWCFIRSLPLADPRATATILGTAGGFFLAGLFVAGLAFLQKGRGDARQGQPAHSVVWWVFGLLALGTIELKRRHEWNLPIEGRLQSPTAETLGPDEVLISSVEGRLPLAYSLDTTTAVSHRQPAFAAFERIRRTTSGLIARVEPRIDPLNGDFGPFSSVLVISPPDLRGPASVERRIPGRLSRLLDVSPAGDRAVFLTRTGIEVIRTADTSTVFARTLSSVRSAAFRDDGSVIALSFDRTAARLDEVASDGRPSRERTYPVAGPNFDAWMHAASQRIAIWEPKVGVTLYGPDAAVIAVIPPARPKNATVRAPQLHEPAFFTRNGDLLVIGLDGIRTVRHGSVDVEKLPILYEGRDVDIAGEYALRAEPFISGELETGEIVVAMFAEGRASSLLVDPSSGTVRRRLVGLRPLARRRVLDGLAAPPRGAGLRVFQTTEGDIVFLDTVTSEPRVLVKSTSHPGL